MILYMLQTYYIEDNFALEEMTLGAFTTPRKAKNYAKKVYGDIIWDDDPTKTFYWSESRDLIPSREVEGRGMGFWLFSIELDPVPDVQPEKEDTIIPPAPVAREMEIA